MNISSRTPEGDDNQCPICGKPVVIEPSRPPGDAPCPHCGCLLWFGADSSLLGGLCEKLSEDEIASMLADHRIPIQIIELVPESVARENTIIPIALNEDELWIAAPRSAVLDESHLILEKLTFILDRKVRLLHS